MPDHTIIIMIPVHMDALVLGEDQWVTEPYARFDHLPFFQARDMHPDIPNLSESVLSVPFQGQNLGLKRGLHLHWSLPDGLTRGAVEGTSQDYPAVPNRWLVTRRLNGEIQRQWIVESDYLHPEGEENLYGSIAFPMDRASGQPFHYMGRALDFNGWVEDAAAGFLPRPKLTAIGYGDPYFAAFYPNCHSVFGCFDEEITEQSQLAGLSYQLIGWYSDPTQDPLVNLLQAPDISSADSETLEQRIKDQFGWNVNLDTGDLPQGITCFADLTFAAHSQIHNLSVDQPVTVTVGNTGTEALSAYLASRLNPANKNQLEEQLENLLLQTELQNKALDLGPRFKEARHEHGFRAESGGIRWAIMPGEDRRDHAPEQIDLPPGMADVLDELNLRQQGLDQRREVLKHQKHVLFADWYKYMLCAYPPDGSRNDYPDVDLVRHFIEEKQLPPVAQTTTEIQAKAAEVALLVENLTERIAVFNRSTLAKAIFSRRLHGADADLSGITLTSPADWQANEPFSSECLSLNGTDAMLTLSGLSGVKSTSLWLNLAADNATGATLLATGARGALITKGNIREGWRKIVIDGRQHPVSRPLLWRNLPHDQWFHLHLEFVDPLTDEDLITLFGQADGPYLKGKLASIRMFNDILSDDELSADRNFLGHHHYELKQAAGPRFWQPNEPVVLLEGVSVEPTKRHGADGRLNADHTLDCWTKTVANMPLQAADLTALLGEIETLRALPESPGIGFDTWETQPWHPFLLEWDIEIFPMAEGGNQNNARQGYEPDFIHQNYGLPENSPALQLKEGTRVEGAAAGFRGRSILTPFAKTLLLERISNQISHLKIEDCYQVLAEMTAAEKANYLQELTTWFEAKPENNPSMAETESWYLDKPVFSNGILKFSQAWPDEAARLSDFNYALFKAHAEVSQRHMISQALSGFNNALKMHHQTLQLPVADPLGFDDYQAFTAAVKDAIGNNTNMAPLPQNDFLPLRSGVLRLHKLHIIDTFGQIKKDISPTAITKAETVALPAIPPTNTQPDDVWLPPRIMQPARIHFRWLAAHSGNQELNTHPGQTPICGWLLANHLDNSVAVYDQAGIALGIIDYRAQWQAVPGNDLPMDLLDVANPFLRTVLQRLVVTPTSDDAADKQSFLQDFMTVTDRALEAIDPESFVHHQELALLMGRPMAVVRAMLNLELHGSPAIHHGWTVFHQDLLRDTRQTDGFENVKIPIRIGERGQLNDGVIGYWKEHEAGSLDQTFVTTVDTAESGLHEAIKGYEEVPLHINHSLGDAPETLTLLIDPRCEIHASTGILPAKKMDIPKDQYAQALKKINLTFLTAPLITGTYQTAIPLPNEVGYEWSWLQKKHFDWVEIARSGLLRKETLLRQFENGPAIWQELLDKGWLAEIDEARARIIPSDQRTENSLAPPINQVTDQIQHLLDASHLVPVETKATFEDKQHIVEGWLKLSPAGQPG